MNMSNRQQLLGIGAIVAVVLLAGDRLVLTPLTGIWKARAAELVQTKKNVAQGSQLLERDKVIRERWDQMRTNMLSGEISVAENQVFRAFERWSQESRIGITGMRPQWRQSGEEYSTLECRVDASGSLAEITRFLHEIEKDPLGLKLDMVEITTRDERGQQLTLTLQVSGLQLTPPMR